MNLKLQERKDGIERGNESLLEYLGMSVMVEDTFSGETGTMKTCVRSAYHTERYLYAILSFCSKVDFFVNGYFGQGEVKKARSS